MRIIISCLALFYLCGCSIAPGGKNDSSASEQAEPGINLTFKELNRPFSDQDFESKKYFFDADALMEEKIYLMSPEGTSYEVSPFTIDEVTAFQLNATFKPHVRSWLVKGDYLWRLDLNELMRSIEPIDLSKTDSTTENIKGYKIKTSTEELGDDGTLRVVGVSKDRMVVKDEKQLYDYSINEEALVKTTIPAPTGHEDWSELKIHSFGQCKERKCYWYLGEEKVYIFIPEDFEKPFSNGEWLVYKSALTFDGGWETFLSLSIVVDLKEDRTPDVAGPSFLTTTAGIYISETGFDRVFTSRQYDASQTYAWENVLDIARDYCITCHTGYLGLENEVNWLERKDVILKYILVEEKAKAFTMPKKGTKQADTMTDDERRIMESWLKAKGADASNVVNTSDSEDGGVTVFALSQAMSDFIAADGPGRCLPCHQNTNNGDDMRLKSWWLNPVRANKSATGNGKDAAIASVQAAAPADWRMPVGGAALNAAQITEFTNLVNGLNLD